MDRRPPTAAEVWAVGAAYEPYVGRWSRDVARRFIAWLARPPGGRWLDVGCGTGALAGAILDQASPAAVLGIDPSAGFVAYARRRLPDPRLRFAIADARALPAPSAAVDAAVSGLVLNFVPDPVAAVAEMARAARPGGVVAAYVWDYAAGMELMRRFWDAAVALDPSAGRWDEGRRFDTICHPRGLVDLFRAAGLRAVESRAIDIPTRFRDFDDYWTPFLGGQGSAPTFVAGLGEDHRAALRDRLRATLPTAADGSIPLTARAWAVRGER